MGNQTCVHCGDDCGTDPIYWEGKPFCCSGCKTVYEILSQSDLDKYYTIEKTPGIKSNSSKKFDFLDNLEIEESLLLFNDSGYKRVKFYIPSIHCSSCLWLLENLPKLHEAVVSSSVHFTKKEVTINFKSDGITLRELAELLTSISYVPHITLQDQNTDISKAHKKSSKRIFFQLGIAAFCFGNIMLLSLPDYMPGSEYLEESFKQFFGIINLILVLPVFFYSGIDYIITAYKTVRKKQVTIDLPIAIGLITLFLETTWEVFAYNEVGYSDSLAGLIFFLLIGKWYQSKTYQALSFDRDYRYYFPIAVTVKNADGSESNIPLEKVKKGDMLLIRNEELIPADSILISGKGNIDYSFVTGEAIPVPKKAKDFLYAGGKQQGSSIVVQVEKDVKQSYLTQLWNETYNDLKDSTSLTILVDRISAYFTTIIISIAVLSFVYWYKTDFRTALYAFTSVLIVACPCALALSIPFTFGYAMRVLGKFGFYLKKAEILEILSKASVAVFDKTGTITYSGDADSEYYGSPLTTEQLNLIKSTVKNSSHPLSRALYQQIEDASEYSLTSFFEYAGKGIKAEVNESTVLIGSAKFCGSNSEALSSTVHISIDDEYLGYYRLKNKYRQELPETFSQLSKRVDLHVISGDNDAEQTVLQGLLSNSAQLHFNQSPTDKLAYIRSLRDEDKTVIMVGDGLNDSGALQESHMGISIAEDVYSFTPASDAILDARRFSNLPAIMKFADKCVTVVKISFIISFLYNIIGLSFAVQGILSPIVAAILMPISSVTVVAFATIATQFNARKLSK